MGAELLRRNDAFQTIERKAGSLSVVEDLDLGVIMDINIENYMAKGVICFVD